jgi:hypothetical protein
MATVVCFAVMALTNARPYRPTGHAAKWLYSSITYLFNSNQLNQATYYFFSSKK